jgi:hypothetical protein
MILNRRPDWEWDEAEQTEWETDFAEMWLSNHGKAFPKSRYAQNSDADAEAGSDGEPAAGEPASQTKH